MLIKSFPQFFSVGVESCEPWATNRTQQIDLAFNIFFMVYFFIRVREDRGRNPLQITFLAYKGNFAR